MGKRQFISSLDCDLIKTTTDSDTPAEGSGHLFINGQLQNVALLQLINYCPPQWTGFSSRNCRRPISKPYMAQEQRSSNLTWITLMMWFLSLMPEVTQTRCQRGRDLSANSITP